jgi:antirestriction protein
LDEDELEELESLKALIEDIRSDWGNEALVDGVTLIRDGYFTQYAQQYAEDTGAITDDPQYNRWPLMYIDWDAAARDLQMDYSAIDFDGETYWVRS